MADGFTFDFTDIYRLAGQFDDVIKELPIGSAKAGRVTGYKIKKAWRASLETSEFPASASTIWYEVTVDPGRVEVVIASTKGTRRAQGFVQAREYGSPTVSPAADAANALRSNVADFERGMGIAAANAIERALNS